MRTIPIKKKLTLLPVLLLAPLVTLYAADVLDPTRNVGVAQRDAYTQAWRQRQFPHPEWIWSGPLKKGATAVIRKSFTLTDPPREATLTAAVNGILDVTINGRGVWKAQSFAPHIRTFTVFGRERTYADFGAQFADVVSFLKVGENSVEFRAVQEGDEAGLLAFLDMVMADGTRLRVATDETWRDEMGKAVTSRGGLGSLTYRWPVRGLDYENHPLADYLRVWPVAPEKAVQSGLGSTAKIGNLAVLLAVDGHAATVGISAAARELAVQPQIVEELQKKRWPITPICGYPQSVKDTDPLLQLKKAAPAAMFDFGREVHGRLQVVSAADEPVQILVQLGESAGEAELLTNLGAQWRTLPPNGSVELPETAFRFAKIWFIYNASGTPVAIDGVKLDYVYYPVSYAGAFKSSDPLLNRIWEIGAYTAHINMQNEIWDGPKRDRSSWAECVYYVSMASHYVFADRFLIRYCMDLHRRSIGTPPVHPANGYVGHTARYLRLLVDYYLFTGDKEFLNAYGEYIIPLVDLMKDRFLPDGQWLFTNVNKDGVHIDCVDPYVVNDRRNWIGTHMILCGAFREAAWLLHRMDGEASAKKAAEIESWLPKMKAAADEAWFDAGRGIYGDDVQSAAQVNALAVWHGVAGAEQARSIYEKLLSRDWPAGRLISPYGMTYLLEAFMHLPEPRINQALDTMRTYYGTLVERGFITFPETDLVHRDPAPDVSGFGPDGHQLGGMYGNSLAHGTSCRQPDFLGRYVLGVWPTEPGFAQCQIKPHVGDLGWVEGTVPTPQGVIRVRHEKRAGGMVSSIDLPQGIRASIALPVFNGAGPRLMVNGKEMQPVSKSAREWLFY